MADSGTSFQSLGRDGGAMDSREQCDASSDDVLIAAIEGLSPEEVADAYERMHDELGLEASLLPHPPEEQRRRQRARMRQSFRSRGRPVRTTRREAPAPVVRAVPAPRFRRQGQHARARRPALRAVRKAAARRASARDGPGGDDPPGPRPGGKPLPQEGIRILGATDTATFTEVGRG